MDRRTFLRGAVALGGAAALGGASRASALRTPLLGPPAPLDTLLGVPASDSPIDHIVVLMMENRSFDHYFGYLAQDDHYLAALAGQGGTIHGDNTRAWSGNPEAPLPTSWWSQVEEENPYRGCGHPDPGHGWNNGRAERDHGFLAEGSGNDVFATGYYRGEDIPVFDHLARRFTIFDRYHCSLLGPTFPNREYMHSAQSGGVKDNSLPPPANGDFSSGELGFQWDTIWDRLDAARVSCGYYFVDLPAIALWGERMVTKARHIEQFFVDAALGALPRVTFVDPGFTTGLRTDDHPFADIRAGQRFVWNVVKGFAESPHWEHGALFVNYDEWGGFFDNGFDGEPDPPLLPDDRASGDDAENFGQAGFRVPCVAVSPYARQGWVDHTLYDHTSILRFIEWRYLGAPATGPGGQGWWLTERDKHANNIGLALASEIVDADLDTSHTYDLPITSLPCRGEELEGLPGVPATGLPEEAHAFEAAMHEGFFERMGFDIDLKPGLLRELLA